MTNNSELADKMRVFRDHGQTRKSRHSMIVWNGRMDDFQGAILSVKLEHLATLNEARRKNARLYDRLLASHGFAAEKLWAESSVWELFACKKLKLVP